MTDNERLFGPLRRRMLAPIEDAEALVRAINATPLGLLRGLAVVEVSSTPRLPGSSGSWWCGRCAANGQHATGEEARRAFALHAQSHEVRS